MTRGIDSEHLRAFAVVNDHLEARIVRMGEVVARLDQREAERLAADRRARKTKVRP